MSFLYSESRKPRYCTVVYTGESVNAQSTKELWQTYLVPGMLLWVASCYTMLHVSRVPTGSEVVRTLPDVLRTETPCLRRSKAAVATGSVEQREPREISMFFRLGEYAHVPITR